MSAALTVADPVPGEEPDRRPYWLIQPCPTWCSSHHEDDDEVEDRVHDASWHARITLTLEDETHEECLDRLKRGYTFEPPQLHLELMQGWRESEPRLWIGWRWTNRGWHLTPAEARELAETLIQGSDLAQGAATTSRPHVRCPA